MASDQIDTYAQEHADFFVVGGKKYVGYILASSDSDYIFTEQNKMTLVYCANVKLTSGKSGLVYFPVSITNVTCDTKGNIKEHDEYLNIEGSYDTDLKYGFFGSSAVSGYSRKEDLRKNLIEIDGYKVEVQGDL